MNKRTLLILLLIFKVFITLGQSNSLSISNIYTDTIWSSDTVKIYNDLIVHDSATLTILGGVNIEFQGHFSIKVTGIIEALGSVNDSIFFTISDTTAFCDTATITGGWGGIRFMSIERIDTSFFQYCIFKYGKAVKPGLTGNAFNDEENMGGCIYAFQYPNIIINNSSFINNHSNYKGGAIHIEDCNYVEITDNYFAGNFTFMYGGGLSIKKAWYFSIMNNVFYNNTAFRTINNTGQTGSGSGVYVTLGITNGMGNVISNKFFNNKSVNGAFYENCLRIRVLNNLVANNEGIGMTQALGYTYNSLYANNTIVNNWGSTVPALWFNSPQSKMINNIIWGNGSDPGFGYQIWSGSGVTANIDYSCVENGYEGEGIIDSYPEFVNPTEGCGIGFDALDSDWSLLDGSPCINIGTPDTTGYNLPYKDIEGHQRIYGYRIDMGAYENQNVVGITKSENNLYKIEVSPNPFTDRFILRLKRPNQVIGITITNQYGKRIKVLDIIEIENLSIIDLSPCKSGIYFIQAKFTDGNSIVKKIIKL